MSDQIDRAYLLDICERAVVPHHRWANRDTPGAQEGVGKAWALLRAGCEFQVLTEGDFYVTDDRTIWVQVTHATFATLDWGGGHETELFYLPTRKRLDETSDGDWY